MELKKIKISSTRHDPDPLPEIAVPNKTYYTTTKSNTTSYIRANRKYTQMSNAIDSYIETNTDIYTN